MRNLDSRGWKNNEWCLVRGKKSPDDPCGTQNILWFCDQPAEFRKSYPEVLLRKDYSLPVRKQEGSNPGRGETLGRSSSYSHIRDVALKRQQGKKGNSWLSTTIVISSFFPIQDEG